MLDQVEGFFDESSVCTTTQPRIVIFMGGPAAGKTTLRKQWYPEGNVLVDAVEIFLRLCRGAYVPFPDELETPMNFIGRLVALRAISERRNIVTEIIGADHDATMNLIESMRSVGYSVEIQTILCDLKVAMERNDARGVDCISAFYAEPYQREWLVNASYLTLHPEKANA